MKKIQITIYILPLVFISTNNAMCQPQSEITNQQTVYMQQLSEYERLHYEALQKKLESDYQNVLRYLNYIFEYITYNDWINNDTRYQSVREAFAYTRDNYKIDYGENDFISNIVNDWPERAIEEIAARKQSNSNKIPTCTKWINHTISSCEKQPQQ